MLSRKRRWEDDSVDSDTNDQEDLVHAAERPAKRRFVDNVIRHFRQMADWVASVVRSKDDDPRNSTVGTAVPFAVLNGDAERGGTSATTDGGTAAHGQAQDPLSPGGPGQRAHTTTTTAAPPHGVTPSIHRTMSSPNGSVIPPFHFSPSPVGRGAAYAHLLSSNAPQRPKQSVGVASSLDRQTADAAVAQQQIVMSSSSATPAASRPALHSPESPQSARQHQHRPTGEEPAPLSPSPSSSPSSSSATRSAPTLFSVQPGESRKKSSSLPRHNVKPRRLPSAMSSDAVRLKERDRYRRLLSQFTAPAGAAAAAAAASRDHSTATPRPAHHRPDADAVSYITVADTPYTYVTGGANGTHAHGRVDEDDIDDDVIITSEINGDRRAAGLLTRVAVPRERIKSTPYGFEPANGGDGDDDRLSAAHYPRHPYPTPGVAPLVGASFVLRPQSTPFRSPFRSSHSQHQQHHHFLQQHHQQQQQYVYSSQQLQQMQQQQQQQQGACLSPSLSQSSPPTGTRTRRRTLSGSEPSLPGGVHAGNAEISLLSDDEDLAMPSATGTAAASVASASRGTAAALQSPAALSMPWAKISSRPAVQKAAGTDWISNICSDVDRTLQQNKDRAEVLERRLQELRIKREENELAETEKMKERLADVRRRACSMRLIDSPFTEEEEEEELPELTDEQEQSVKGALRSGSSAQVLVSAFNVDMTRGDLATLKGSGWLNDEVINYFFQLIKARNDANDNMPSVHVMTSFFYPKLLATGYSSVKRWTRKVDIFSKDMVAVPIHLGMHWCLAMIDFREKSIVYYDSLLGKNTECLTALENYIQQESKDKKKQAYDTSDWSLQLAEDIPEQLNGCDCGVFACTYAAYLARGKSFNFSQDDMPYFRRRMVCEILSKGLLL